MELKNSKYKFLKSTELKPTGWLKKQLEIQNSGLTGNLDLFWPDVKDSAWFGGDAEGWERAPYWLDGAIPLAYMLEDQKLILRVEGYVDYIIKHQSKDGWLGPKKMNVENVELIFIEGGNYDIWAQFLILKVLVMYYEINEDKVVFEAVKKGLKCIDKHINYSPLFNWGQARWFEALIPIYWYYEKTGENWTLELASKLRAQGFEWGEFFKYWPFKEATPKGKWNYMSHVVNNTMAVKAYGMWYRISNDERDLETTNELIKKLEKYHGTVVETITGDECLAGTSSIRGTELCSVVEYMYSLEQLVVNTGNLSLVDKLETITFNALPATISEDMWSHQYDQQVNQIECSSKNKWPWNTNDNDANIFGLQPHFGCCTSNMHQGWPKFAGSVWLQDEIEDLTVISYVPCKINKKIKGAPIKIEVNSEYPFKNDVAITVENQEKQEFCIYLRIPEWSKETRVEVNGKDISSTLRCIKVPITGEKTLLNIKFKSEIEKVERNKSYFAVKKGPLIYSHRIEADWKQINQDVPGRELPHADWELYAKSKWNYTVDINSELQIIEDKVGNIPFSESNPPIKIHANGIEIKNWASKDGSPDDIPKEIELGKEKEIILIPYGCSKLRITEFPKL